MKIPEDQIISPEMDKFLDEVDKLCFEHGFQILPNNEESILIVADQFIRNEESCILMYIDGDGRGK